MEFTARGDNYGLSGLSSLCGLRCKSRLLSQEDNPGRCAVVCVCVCIELPDKDPMPEDKERMGGWSRPCLARLLHL